MTVHRQNLDNALLERALDFWNERALSSAFDADEAGHSILDMFEKALGREPSSYLERFVISEFEKQVDRLLDFPSHRLAVYGSLAPGAENQRVLSELKGVWTKGIVKGHRDAAGWGQTFGFPALIWDPNGAEIAVDLFHSPELPKHWNRIDEFEGDDYQRILVPIQQGAQVVVANIYALPDRR
jgi:gamma-glutamylcyclotransferase (GGCT)/AIG2-like uncharacterized protein YtfP